MFGYRICSNKKDFFEALMLTKKFYKYINIQFPFVGDSDMLEEFIKIYSNPDGGFIIATNEKEEVIGGVGIREVSNDTCELKRLFVDPNYFRNGIGEKLCRKIIALADELGFDKICLDTEEKYLPANKLFRKLGFIETERYLNNPSEESIFFEYKIKE